MVVNQQKNADYESDNVKDKNNILSFNQAFATEYMQDLTGFEIFGGNAESSNNNSYSNNYSLKIIKESSYSDVRLGNTGEPFGLTVPAGTRLRFNCKIYCTTSKITINCANQGNEGSVKVEGGIIGEWTDITITFTATSGKFTIAFQSINNINNIIYVDNLSLEVV